MMNFIGGLLILEAFVFLAIVGAAFAPLYAGGACCAAVVGLALLVIA